MVQICLLLKTADVTVAYDNRHSVLVVVTQPFDVYCCHIGTDIKHFVPDRVKPSFVIFDIWAL